MKLSIIIPFKGQDERKLAIPLASINGQVGVDFSEIDIHLINDAGPKISLTRLELFSNLQLRLHQLPVNLGPGLARQYGIDHSKSDYLMFMDADDELQNVEALKSFFDVLERTGDHQLLIGNYLEQYRDERGRFNYLLHDATDSKAVYAKLYQRAYLEELGLRFHPLLRLFEDNYFVGLACECAQDIYRLDSTVYNWLYNPESIVRSDEHFFSRQTAVIPWAMQYYFEFLESRFPEKIQLEDYLVNAYLRAYWLGDQDQVAFWTGHRSLLTKFASGKTFDFPSLQQRVIEACKNEPFWKETDPTAFAKFFRKSGISL